MEIRKKLSEIKTKDDFIEFVGLLSKDLKENPGEWENSNLESYLNAVSAWTGDMEGYYTNTKQEVPKNVNWKVFADILYAAKMYE